MRKKPLVIGEAYHIFTKSIAGFKVFNENIDFERMQQLFDYYKVKNDIKFSDFIDSKIVCKYGFYDACDIVLQNKEKLVQVICFCLMPTHIHLILKQLLDGGISDYINHILNCYTRYFNIKHNRKGPLWESRFKSVLIDSDEQLLHLTRYIHLNPVTAKFVNRPGDWKFSSYKEYISRQSDAKCVCQFDNILEIEPLSYRNFVNDRISYQRELAKIKSLKID